MQEAQLTGRAGEHVVLLYEHDSELVERVGEFLLDGLRAGDAVLVVATADHRRRLSTFLSGHGLDVSAATADGRLHLLDADATLAQFVADGRPDAAAFDDVVGRLVRTAGAGGRQVRAFGEMVARLWDDGFVTAAIELEELWNDLGRQTAFSLFCAYPVQSLRDSDHEDAVHDVCCLHTAVLPERREAVRHFEATLDAPLASRRFVTEALTSWGHHDVVDDAAMVVTELATNAVLHACGRFTTTVSTLGDTVRIAVQDDSPYPAVLRSLSLTSQTGRGLAMVAAVSIYWGSEARADGKVTWADLRPPI